jgi:excisionase family DNA binding protein
LGFVKPTQSPSLQPILLRTREVAQLLSVSESQVLNWSRAGQLHPVTIPGIRATRFRRDEVEQLAARWFSAAGVEAQSRREGQQ